ncbi:MAG: MbnP family protein, partial [Verrucomicrobiota bacterium]
MNWISTVLAWSAAAIVSAADFQIVFEHSVDERPVVLGRELDGIRVSRIDWLISDFAFQQEDGEWFEAENWVEFVSEEQKRLTVSLGASPSAKFKAVRFRVGLTPELNHLDPNRIAPDSPLHPLVNGLHWGWQAGFVFAAVEGARDGEAFSYHLGNDGNDVVITLAVKLETPRDSRLQIGFDLAPIFRALKSGSTHSREEDPMVPAFVSAIENGFSIKGIATDTFQQLQIGTAEIVYPKGTTPFALNISKRLPRVSFPSDNLPTIEGVSLGEDLFFDPRLSGTNEQSCASCHDPKLSFADSRKLSLGANGQIGRRNSMPLINLAWHDRFFWDGRATTLREQVLMPIQDPTEMNQQLPDLLEELRADRATVGKFENAFGSSEISEASLAKALEQFVITRISQNSKFDRAARGEVELTEQEKRGLALFVTEFDPKNGHFGADCFHCHGGNLFTTRRFTNNGIQPLGEDFGLYETTGDPTDRGKFKTPTLRNVELTAPYMHDGRFATLEEVV